MNLLCGTGRERPPDDGKAPTKKNGGPSNPNVHEWERDEVLQWVRKIGKQEYETEFQRSNIVGKRLLQLKREDLKKMGIKDESDLRDFKKEINRLNKSQQALINKHNDDDDIRDNRDSRDRNHRDRDRDRDRRDDGYNDRDRDRDRGYRNKSKSPMANGATRQQPLTKSKSDYLTLHASNPHHQQQQQQLPPPQLRQGIGNTIEFNTQAPLGRGGGVNGNGSGNGMDKDTFREEKKLDKQKYFGVWQALVGNQDILLQTRYNIIMKTSKLQQQDLSIIWRMGTN